MQSLVIIKAQLQKGLITPGEAVEKAISSIITERVRIKEEIHQLENIVIKKRMHEHEIFDELYKNWSDK